MKILSKKNKCLEKNNNGIQFFQMINSNTNIKTKWKNTGFLAVFIIVSVLCSMSTAYAELPSEADKKEEVIIANIQSIDLNESHFLSNEFLIKIEDSSKKAIKENKIGLILSLEGLEPIHRELELLNTFYELGVRGFGVTWARRNFVADGSYFRYPEEGVLGGLTPFGIQVMKKATELGYFVDVSHINDVGFDDVFKYTNSPIIASHSNASSLCKHRRNLTDDQIKTLANSGGLIGMNSFGEFVAEDKSKK